MDNIESRPDFKVANKLIRQLLQENSSELDEESQEFARHYLDHDEYELAFEGLFLGLITHGTMKSSEKLNTYVALGKSLKLDKESIIDAHFWSKLLHFVQRVA